jgi:sugar phosphate permease
MESKPRFTAAQSRVIVLLLLGYTGYYLCRTFFAVVKPLLLAEYGSVGLDKAMLGYIASTGTLAYAIGKVINGSLADFLGGKRVFWLGMVASVVCTVAFGLAGGITAFLIIWVLNRLVQSAGWGALVKVASQWFHYQQYGRVMALLSLSFLFGDSLIRLLLGAALEYGLGWREVCFLAAGGLTLIALLVIAFLPAQPPASIAEKLEVNPANLFGAEGEAAKPKGVLQLLKPYFSSLSFWMVLLISFGMTGLRETFNEWLNTYLKETSSLSSGGAAMWSALFPFLGGVSCLIAGSLSDIRPNWGRGRIILFTQLALALVFLFWWMVGSSADLWLRMGLAGLSGLLLIGPYTFLAGAIAMDLGGRQGSSTAAGLIDAMGYVGAMLAVSAVGSVAQAQGWGSVFGAMAALSLLTAIAAGLYHYLQPRPKPNH